MKRVALAAAFLSAVSTVGVAYPASAAPEGEHRPCVTGPEYDRMPQDEGKQSLERFIDTRGWIAFRSIDGIIKHYKFCDHPYGWLAVSYVPSKPGGWMVVRTMLIYYCQHRSPLTAPYVPCDPKVPSIFEATLLRK